MENYICSWQIKTNVLDVQNRRYVILKSGLGVSQVDLGSFSAVTMNLFTYTRNLKLGNALTANLVDDGGTHKIRISTTFGHTGLSYNRWPEMDVIDLRVNLALINTVTYNEFTQIIIFNEGNKIHFFQNNMPLCFGFHIDSFCVDGTCGTNYN
jgi:hypothetical protein